MMSRLRTLVQRNKYLQTIFVILLCVGLLVLLLMQTARVVNPEMRRRLQEATYSLEPDTLLIGTWQFASAHKNIQLLQWQRQRAIGIDMSGLLLVAQGTTSSLALILPLLALFTALTLSRAKPMPDMTHSVRSWALSMSLLSLAVPVTVGLFLVLESRVLEIAFVWSQWSRLLVWLGCLGIYFAAFLFLGSWISQSVCHVKTAAWIFLSLFVALFMIQSSRTLLMRFDGSLLPPVPDLPAEVRLSLFRPSGEPRVTPDREAMVADYLASVDAYSESIHTVVAARYRLERWWHVVSPQLLLNEISSQLLQTQLADVMDVVFTPKSEDTAPSLTASLMSVWPELAWLALLSCLTGFGAWFTTRKQVISP